MKLSARDVSVIHIVPYWGVECSAIVGNTHYHLCYIDYPTRDALRMFGDYVLSEEEKNMRAT